MFVTDTAAPADIAAVDNCAELKRLGLDWQEHQQYWNAIEAFKRMVAIDPNDPEANNLLGRVYFLVNDIEKAKLYLKIALALDDEYAEAHYNLGDVYYREGDLNAAMNAYKTAISINEAFRKRKRSFF